MMFELDYSGSICFTAVKFAPKPLQQVKDRVKLSLVLINEALRREGVWGSEVKGLHNPYPWN
jgi:hypothetical protein